VTACGQAPQAHAAECTTSDMPYVSHLGMIRSLGAGVVAAWWARGHGCAVVSRHRDEGGTTSFAKWEFQSDIDGSRRSRAGRVGKILAERRTSSSPTGLHR